MSPYGVPQCGWGPIPTGSPQAPSYPGSRSLRSVVSHTSSPSVNHQHLPVVEALVLPPPPKGSQYQKRQWSFIESDTSQGDGNSGGRGGEGPRKPGHGGGGRAPNNKQWFMRAHFIVLNTMWLGLLYGIFYSVLSLVSSLMKHAMGTMGAAFQPAEQH